MTLKDGFDQRFPGKNEPQEERKSVMKKIIKKLIIFTLVTAMFASMSVNVFAAECKENIWDDDDIFSCSGIWFYEYVTFWDKPTIKITGMTITGGNDGNGYVITIPSEIDGNIVVGIGKYAFLNNSAYGVFIPDTITEIEQRAFFNCKNLSSVTIPQSVNRIGIEAFTGCYNLKTITILGNPTLSLSALGTQKVTVKTLRSSTNVINYCRGKSNITLSYIVTTPITPKVTDKIVADPYPYLAPAEPVIIR